MKIPFLKLWDLFTPNLEGNWSYIRISVLNWATVRLKEYFWLLWIMYKIYLFVIFYWLMLVFSFKMI